MASSSRRRKDKLQADLLMQEMPMSSNIHDGFSDSEAAYQQSRFRSRDYQQLATSMPDLKQYAKIGTAVENSDDDMDGGTAFQEHGKVGNRTVRTGRQRKKLAARSKGGEFQTKRKKRRCYFCCVSSEIDVEKLMDHLHGAEDLLFDWKFQLQNEVLHMYKAGIEDPAAAAKASSFLPFETAAANGAIDMHLASSPHMHMLNPQNPLHGSAAEQSSLDGAASAAPAAQLSSSMGDAEGISLDAYLLSRSNAADPITRQDSTQTEKPVHSLTGIGAKEVFVFDFGAAVFWGFPRGEETGILKTIRMFVTKGMVGTKEFESGEDDMAFVISPEVKSITIANDVISLPDECDSKQRLAVSFAIAQSSVLSIFEARIEQKVEEYKYIPETLAAVGKVHLSERQLGMMIGEVFVIRHDVNLHTEILDTPDFFWKEWIFEADYKMVCSYLEMSGRTEILNKRLDMLRELLDVLQQQMENAHAVKLEWIVIYLIVAEVVLQGLAIICSNFL